MRLDAKKARLIVLEPLMIFHEHLQKMHHRHVNLRNVLHWDAVIKRLDAIKFFIRQRNDVVLVKVAPLRSIDAIVVNLIFHNPCPFPFWIHCSFYHNSTDYAWKCRGYPVRTGLGSNGGWLIMKCQMQWSDQRTGTGLRAFKLFLSFTRKMQFTTFSSYVCHYRNPAAI